MNTLGVFSALRDIMINVEVYHENIIGCSVDRRSIMTHVKRTIIRVGDTVSTLGVSI